MQKRKWSKKEKKKVTNQGPQRSGGVEIEGGKRFFISVDN
jgi:hypothetical protein